MSRKFFSLIFGSQVTLAPGKKWVPAKEFSQLQTAAEIVAHTEQEQIEGQKKIAEEMEAAKQKGKEEGFQEGLTSFNKHLLALDEELKELRLEIQKKILPVSLSAARKLIGEELRLHPDRVVDIILNSLKPVTQHKKVAIYVNKADLHFVEEQRPKIKEIFEHLQSLSIQERNDIEPGGCIIETEAGIINAQLENQWRALESAFASFMEK